MKGTFTKGVEADIPSAIQLTKDGRIQWQIRFNCFTTKQAYRDDTFLQHFWVFDSNEVRLSVKDTDTGWRRHLVPETPQLRAELMEAILLGGLE